MVIPLMSMEYDPWQKRILEAEGDLLVCTGRQVGKTMTMSHKIAQHLLDNPKHQIIVVSLTLDQAELIIVMILDYLEKNHRNLIQKGKKKPTKSRVFLKNGAGVISRPVGTTGDAMRGFTGNVLYVDEAAGMPEIVWKAALPTLATTGGQIWMTSTPRGKFVGGSAEKNFFYKQYENLDDQWQIFEINTEKVYNERPVTDLWTQEKSDKSKVYLERQKRMLTDMEYRQEYLAQFLDDNRQWFEDDTILSSMTEERPSTINRDGIYFLGVDVARMGEDLSAFQIFELRKDHLFQVENLTTSKTTLPQTFERIKQLHKMYDFARIFIDSVGIGVGVFDWLMWDDDTKAITEAIDNSKQIMDKDGKTRKLMKTLKYAHARMLMETGKIHLLKDGDIFQSFKSTQYAHTNDNLGTRHLKIFSPNNHICEGACNAIWGEKEKYKHSNIMVHSIPV